MKKTSPGRIALEAIKNLFKKPATTEYAGKGAPEVEKNYRGMLIYNPDDCISCGLCMRDCPTGAIKVTNEGTKEDKKMSATLDTGKCIFCCQCVYSCPKECLSYTQNIDFARTDKDGLTVDL